MFIVGLTGGIATGKSTVLSIFRNEGIAVIDADDIARKVLEPGTTAWKEVRQHFGDDVLSSDNRICRARLGEIVFNDIEKRRKLNAITHPRIQSAMIKIAIKYFIKGHKYIVMELPLLFETGRMLSVIHKIITVACDNEEQLERLCKRNDLSFAVAMKRIDAQLPLDIKIARSHFVIDNTGTIEETTHQTELIIKVLRRSNFTLYVRVALTLGLLGLLSSVTYLFLKLFKII